MAIRLLSQDVINKIAAGEVIERPASVIKECLENSIDAGASRIEIVLEDSGKRKIVVSDDGSGMDESDLKLCVLKHATSKIFSSEDLFRISTLGFRGEALASIETISRMTIQTRIADSDFGFELSNFERPDASRYGEQFSIRKIAMEPGTKIIVQDIFYNTPARLNYLKNDYVELSHILDLVKKYALCFPGKSFRVSNNGKTIFMTSGQNEELTNIKQIFNDKFTEHMIRVEHKDAIGDGNTDPISDVVVQGFISEPGYLTATSENIIFFLNDRFIKSRFLSDAVLDAYKTMSFLSEKPAAIMHLYIDPGEFDINVHPRKLDVKFMHESRLYEIIISGIRTSISSFNESRKVKVFNDKSVQSRLESISADYPTEGFSKDIAKVYSVRNRTSDAAYQKGIPSYDDTSDIADPEDIVDGKTKSSDGIQYDDVQYNGSDAANDVVSAEKIEPADDSHEQRAALPEEIEDADYTKYLAKDAVNKDAAKERPADIFCDDGTPDMGDSYDGTDIAEGADVNDIPTEETGDSEICNGPEEIGPGYVPDEAADGTSGKSDDARDIFAQKGSEQNEYKHNVLGIIDNTFILVKSGDSIFVVDQHALHERILFERLKDEFDDNLSKKNTQTLLSPIRIELSPKSLEALFDRKEFFERIGFEFEVFGNSAILLRRIPYALMDIADKSELINAILSDFDFGKMEDSVLERLATISCKAAIKAHDELTERQVDNLLDMFFSRGMMHTCPHGRPFFIEIGKKEIERMFKRA